MASRDEIASVIALQEELGLDVLVPQVRAERNDMVQYFAENFDGFATTPPRPSLRVALHPPLDPVRDVKRHGEGLR